MNCPKCQALVPAGAAVCPTCGEKMPAAKPAKKKLPIPLIAGGAVALIIAIVLICVLPGAGAKSVVSKQFKAFEKEDGEALYDLIPQLYIDAYNDGRDDDDKLEKDDIIKACDNTIDDKIKDRPDDFKASYKIIDTVKVKKDIVEQFNEYLDKDSVYKDVYNADEHEITAVTLLVVKYECSYGDYTDEDYSYMIAIKENGKWKDGSYLSVEGFSWFNGDVDEKDFEDYMEFYAFTGSYTGTANFSKVED